MAEREGFEPPDEDYPSTVFKTAAFDRSATSPISLKPLYYRDLQIYYTLCKIAYYWIYSGTFEKQ